MEDCKMNERDRQDANVSIIYKIRLMIDSAEKTNYTKKRFLNCSTD